MLLLILLAAPFAADANQAKTAGGSRAALIPMKDFFRNPEKTAFALSPNGEYLAFMQPW
jgi:hypothetical protein